LLEGESEKEFTALLSGLRVDLQPIGALEETLVEKLATLFWRYRRLIRAEAGEIGWNTNFIESDENLQNAKDANQIAESESAKNEFMSDTRSGLIWHIENPIVLNGCLELLRQLEESIKSNGFDDSDSEVLKKLYGTNEHPSRTLKDEYDTWSNTADATEEERQENGYATPEECVAYILGVLKSEIKRLNDHGKTHKQLVSAKVELDKIRGTVPSSSVADHLLKYEASIERAIDRTLSQLERRQRLRQGQAPVADINLNVSHT
jgi:hypothetical protein